MKFRRILLAGWLCVGLLFLLYMVSTLRANRYKRWVFEAGAAITQAPALCRDGTLLTGSYRPLFALESATGRSIWTFNYPDLEEYQGAGPIVGTDDCVYLGSQKEGRPHQLYALDSRTGKQKWAVVEEVTTLVLGEQGRIYGGFKEALALDSRTGNRLWKFSPPGGAAGGSDLWNNDGHIEDMAYSEGMVLVTFGCPYKRLYALDAETGKPRWNVTLEDKKMAVCSAPASLTVTKSGLVMVGELDGDLRALDSSTGQLRWRFQPESAPLNVHTTAGDGVVYVVTYEGEVYALDEKTGSIRWRQDLGEGIFTPPAIGADGVLYVGTRTNRVYALNSLTGKPQWNLSFGWLTRSFPYGDSVAVTIGLDGTVYAASTDGRLYALRRPSP